MNEDEDENYHVGLKLTLILVVMAAFVVGGLINGLVTLYVLLGLVAALGLFHIYVALNGGIDIPKRWRRKP